MIRADLAAAFILLTRFPVGRFAEGGAVPDLARCVWAFPVVGGAIGLGGGLCYWLGCKAGMPLLLAGVWSLAAMLAMSGGLHEDGLADTADGFGGGMTVDRKLDIMRDSRIGSFGVLALVLTSVVRISAVAAISKPEFVVIGLILAGMLGRGAMVLPLLLLAPARPDGMGASMGRPHVASTAFALVIASFAPFVCLPIWGAIVTVGLAACMALAIARLAAVQIHGYTGDVLGASAVGVECIVLTVLACLFSVR